MEFKLRKWELRDADDIALCANNVEIANNLRNAFPFPYTLEDAKSYVSSCIKNADTTQICRAIVIDNHTVGSIGIFLGNDVYCKSGELGYWLAEEYWGKGIMSIAVKQLCQIAFDQFDIIRIYAEPFAHNIGSRKVLEHAGFSLEGIMKQGVFKYGNIYDYCMYALLKA
jgi:ribosomal-protein-alanine N-acetyltransferase